MARRPGRLLTLLGVLTLVAGLVGAVVLVAAASQRRSNAVEGFARAPVGCDTTLDFAESGEFLVFVERSGSVSSVSGNCDVPVEYDVSGGIDVVVTLVDPAGADIELDRAIGSIDYDVDGFVGEAAFTVDIAEAGDHVMRVESDDGAFAVAVGPDPADGLAALFGGAAAAGAIGLVVGLGMILTGRSRRRQAARQIAPVGPYGTPFSPVGQVPQGPPTYAHPGGPVNYGAPTPPPPGPGVGAPRPGPSWQPTAPPPSPGGMPRYEPPPPPMSPPSATPPPPPPPPAPPATSPPPLPPAPPVSTGPPIPGEPNWVAPGAQPSAPIAMPIPPDTGARPELSSDAQVARPEDRIVRPSLDDETDVRGVARSNDDDDTPTVERPRWDLPPSSD